MHTCMVCFWITVLLSKLSRPRTFFEQIRILSPRSRNLDNKKYVKKIRSEIFSGEIFGRVKNSRVIFGQGKNSREFSNAQKLGRIFFGIFFRIFFRIFFSNFFFFEFFFLGGGFFFRFFFSEIFFLNFFSDF